MADEIENTRMTLGEHLAELRTRLLKGVVGVAIAFSFAWWHYERITEIVMAPFYKAVDMMNAYFADLFAKKVASGEADALDYFTTTDPQTWQLLPEFESADKLTVLAPAEGFTFILRICLYFALFIGGPFLLWQMWQFLAAGLYKKERKAALRYFPFSAILFITGVLFGYYLMVPYGMYYLGIALDTEVLRSQYRLSDYFSLLTALSLALALVFQLPVMMTFATRLGLLEPKQLIRSRPYVIVGAFVVAAVLTPPDPVTQCMMAIPIILLFEVGLISARLCAKPREIPPEPPS